MKISDVRELLKKKEVVEEINRHLWIESQKAGYSIGIERATDEWLRLYAEGWLKYHLPSKYKVIYGKKNKSSKAKTKAKKVVKAKKKIVKPKKTKVKKVKAKKTKIIKKKKVK